jgi:uncharacterized protein
MNANGDCLKSLNLTIHIPCGERYKDTNQEMRIPPPENHGESEECRGDAASRIFAWELLHPDTRVDTSHPAVHTVYSAGGAVCRNLYVCGVLTELVKDGDDILRGRLADPTGAFPLFIGRPELLARDDCISIQPPSFVACCGKIEVLGGGPGRTVSIRPWYVHRVERAVRDAWIVRTAQCTLERIQIVLHAIESGKGLSREDRLPWRGGLPKRENLVTTARMALAALEQVDVHQHPQNATDLREELLALISDLSGPRGVAVDEVVDRLKSQGVAEEEVLSVIRDLIAEDEVYQPQKGFVRIL